MRKTKESLAHPATVSDSRIREAQEAENEEMYEAIGGETSTEGVGRGFDADAGGSSGLERAESTADGPMTGEMNDPPVDMPRRKRKKSKHGIHRANSPSNHAAANSTKSI